MKKHESLKKIPNACTWCCLILTIAQVCLPLDMCDIYLLYLFYKKSGWFLFRTCDKQGNAIDRNCSECGKRMWKVSRSLICICYIDGVADVIWWLNDQYTDLQRCISTCLLHCVYNVITITETTPCYWNNL